MQQEFRTFPSTQGQEANAFSTGVMNWRDFCFYAGDGAGAFEAAFRGWRGERKTIGAFCWPAFCAPIAWLLYRKIYGAAAFWAIAPLGLSPFAPYPALVALSMAINGFYGQRLYVRSAASIMRSIHALARDEREAQIYFSRAAGASRSGAVVGALITIATWVLSAASLYVASLALQ